MTDKALSHLAADLGSRALQSAVTYTLARVRANARRPLRTATGNMYYQRDGKTLSFKRRRPFPGGARVSGSYKVRRTGLTRKVGYYDRFNRLDKTEQKFIDIDMLPNVVTQSLALVSDLLVLIPQGVTESERIGRKAFIRSIAWRYTLKMPRQTSTPASDIIRFLLVIDKQCNGVVATGAEIFEHPTSLHSFRNLVNVGRFRVLMDRTVSLNPLVSDTATDVNEFMRTGSFYHKCNIPIEYSGALGTTIERKSNNISAFALSQNGVAEITSSFRLRFTD